MSESSELFTIEPVNISSSNMTFELPCLKAPFNVKMNVPFNITKETNQDEKIKYSNCDFCKRCYPFQEVKNIKDKHNNYMNKCNLCHQNDIYATKKYVTQTTGKYI